MHDTSHGGRAVLSGHHAGAVRRRVYLLVLSFALLVCFPSVSARAVEKLTPEYIKNLVPQFFKWHLQEHEMNSAFMKRVLKEYVNQLDPSKSFFLKAEAEALSELSEDELKSLALKASAGDFAHFTTLLSNFLNTQVARDAAFFDGLENRAEEIKALSKEKPKTAAAGTPDKDPILDKAVQKDAAAAAADDDEMDESLKGNERPLTHAERETRLLKLAAYYFRVNRTYMSDNDALKQALHTVREERKRWLNVNVEDEVPKLFLKSFMQAMDPHTAYMDVEEDEEFTSRLEPSFAGIGVQIRPVPLGAFVEDIIKGGPSELSGRLARGDQIVSVDDYVLAGLTINKIVRRIKGKKGTEVKLQVLKRETKKTETITLVRDTINLGDMRVKGKKFESPAGPVAVVKVETFYRHDDEGGVHTNGVTEDLRDRILALGKEQPLAGLVLDLRDNHGGYLDEAVTLAGLFITSGPIVGERDGRSKVAVWKNDPDAGIVYGGPLVILVNQFSASASEIVAGALKDYGRAVVVSSTQTFGKGTVQRVIPLSTWNLPGEVKITTHQYFLPDGASVQRKGVEPDVTIPGWELIKELLEEASENSIPWAQIPGKLNHEDPDVRHWTEWKNQNLALLQEKSKQRVAANPELRDFVKAMKRKNKLAAEKLEAMQRKPDEAPQLSDDKKDEKDLLAEEAVAVAADMAATWPKPENKQAVK
ncbi:MAG: S41 family peptidase [Planctomycetota bacterium]